MLTPFIFHPTNLPCFLRWANGICAGHFRGDQPQRRAESTETVRLGGVDSDANLGGFPLGIS